MRAMRASGLPTSETAVPGKALVVARYGGERGSPRVTARGYVLMAGSSVLAREYGRGREIGRA